MRATRASLRTNISLSFPRPVYLLRAISARRERERTGRVAGRVRAGFFDGPGDRVGSLLAEIFGGRARRARLPTDRERETPPRYTPHDSRRHDSRLLSWRPRRARASRRLGILPARTVCCRVGPRDFRGRRKFAGKIADRGGVGREFRERETRDLDCGRLPILKMAGAELSGRERPSRDAVCLSRRVLRYDSPPLFFAPRSRPFSTPSDFSPALPSSWTVSRDRE